MKTSEQMTKDVLARRDKELKDNRARRRRILMIGAPCAAAVLVASAVGIDSAVRGNIRYIHPIIANGENSGGYNSPADDYLSNAMTSGPEIAPSTDDEKMSYITSAWQEHVNSGGWLDYTNPKSGQNDIHIIEIKNFHFGDDMQMTDPSDLRLYTMERLNSYYGIEFDRLTRLHPDWELQHDPLGIYIREENGGYMASVSAYRTLNTLNYTTDKGAGIIVMAQRLKFDSLHTERFAKDKPFTPTLPEAYSDPAGSYGGIGAYNPDKDPNKPTNDEGVSLLNGYDAYIYRDSNGAFAADIDMGTRVRILAGGLSEEEFLQILDEYTA